MFFMMKNLKRVGICFLIAVFVWMGMIVVDRQKLRQELIRLHVVAASDSAEDQALKLQVRDAVVDSLSRELANVTDVEQAKVYLQSQLPRIQNLAQQVLEKAGCSDRVQVSLELEEFTKRIYDTFTLPAGLYDALRIVIGEGEGHNWWCVVFPSLCLPATAAGFEDVAVGSGFSDRLTHTLEEKGGYQIRFFLLDVVGRIENFFHHDAA